MLERDHVDDQAATLGVLQRAPRDAQVGQRCHRVAGAHRAGGGQGGHVRQRLAGQSLGQGAEHADVDSAGACDAQLDAIQYGRRVDHRSGVWRQAQGGNPGGVRGLGFGADGGFLRRPRLAQAGAQVDGAGHQPLATGVDGRRVGLARPLGTDAADDAIADADEADGVGLGHRVEDAGAREQQAFGRLARGFHRELPALAVSLSMAITAIRTAMPWVTCCKISERSP